MIKSIMKCARTARDNAYAPYSRVQVGAAVLFDSDEIYTGCNVENASYGLSICAERSAIFKAVCAGERDIKAICVISNFENIIYPCGACLQVMAEFTKNPFASIIISAAQGGDYEIRTLADHLPARFQLTDVEVL